MPDLTTTLPDTHVGVSQRLLKSQIDSYRQQQFTGLLRLRFPVGSDVVVVFLTGVQQQLYRCLNQKMEAIPQQSWPYTMDRSDASIASLRLSLEAMRLMRVAHEAPVLHQEKMLCSPKELTEWVGMWVEESQPAILHVQSPSCNKILLSAGNATPVMEELTISDNDGTFSLNDTSFAVMLPEGEYRITRYGSDLDHEAWQEFELRYAFNPFMRMMIYRFSELAGRVLAERLCENLSRQVKNGGWNIDISMNGVANHHYFDSFESARSAYLVITRHFLEESSQAIGARLADRIAFETMHKLGLRLYDFLRRHIYNKDALEIAAGGSWRFGA